MYQTQEEKKSTLLLFSFHLVCLEFLVFMPPKLCITLCDLWACLWCVWDSVSSPISTQQVTYLQSSGPAKRGPSQLSPEGDYRDQPSPAPPADTSTWGSGGRDGVLVVLVWCVAVKVVRRCMIRIKNTSANVKRRFSGFFYHWGRFLVGTLT